MIVIKTKASKILTTKELVALLLEIKLDFFPFLLVFLVCGLVLEAFKLLDRLLIEELLPDVLLEEELLDEELLDDVLLEELVELIFN